MLTDSLKILAATRPPAQSARSIIANLNGQIAVLEKQLGLQHTFTLNIKRAEARLAELQGMVKTAAPAAPARPVASSEPAISDYLKMSAADRRQFAQDGGVISKQTFEALTHSAKMEFCRSGGKVEPQILKSFNTGGKY